MFDEKQFAHRKNHGTRNRLILNICNWILSLCKSCKISIYPSDVAWSFDWILASLCINKLWAFGMHANLAGVIRNFLRAPLCKIRWFSIGGHGLSQGNLRAKLFGMCISEIQRLYRELWHYCCDIYWGLNVYKNFRGALRMQPSRLSWRNVNANCIDGGVAIWSRLMPAKRTSWFFCFTNLLTKPCIYYAQTLTIS